MRLRLLPLFALPLFLACAAPAADDDFVDESADELSTKTCELGATCPSPMKLLSAIDYGTRAPARFRSDVQVDTTTPRVIRQLTSRRMTAKADATLKLRAFEVDDLVLFEVLDAQTGARIDAAYAGTPAANANVTVGGAPAKRIGPSAFVFGAGTVDLHDVLPRDRVFRLRVSALDYGGAARVTDVLADVGTYEPPAPEVVATDRTQSVLRSNSSPLAKDFTAALDEWTVKQRYDMSYGFPFFKMLVYGFNLEAPTHAAFANETSHFNITPLTEVGREWLDGIVAWWQPKIDELRAKVTNDHATGLITTADRDKKIAVLNALQAIVDGSMKPLRATFDRYPEVAKIKLDLR